MELFWTILRYGRTAKIFAVRTVTISYVMICLVLKDAQQQTSTSTLLYLYRAVLK